MQNIITQLLNSRSLKTLNKTLQTSPETNFRFIYSFIYLFIFFLFFCSQMYIELFGPGRQPKGVWDSVRLRVRHLSRGYFRAGNGQIKSYHQPITEFRTLKFDRFSISDEQRCRAHKSKGDKASKFSYFLINREFLVCNRVTRRPCWKWKQYNVFFSGRICISSQRREMLLFLTSQQDRRDGHMQTSNKRAGLLTQHCL